jgi:hypothetical protein
VAVEQRLGLDSLDQLVRAYCTARDLIEQLAGVICSAQPLSSNAGTAPGAHYTQRLISPTIRRRP